MSGTLTLIYEKGEDGWWVATIAEFPGAFSQGRTRAQAKVNALDALAELMAARRDLALRERATGAEIESLAFSA